MDKKAKVAAIWNKQHTVQFSLKYNKDKHADVIEKLRSVDNIQGYVRDLIRADIAKGTE